MGRLEICAAQRVEHYEMAGYGTARALAQRLGDERVAGVLQKTLTEEGRRTRISLRAEAPPPLS